MLKRRMVRLGAALALFTACTTTEDDSDSGDRGAVTLRADASAVVEGHDSELDSGSEETPTDSDEDADDAPDRELDAGVDSALDDPGTDSGINHTADAALDAAGDSELDDAVMPRSTTPATAHSFPTQAMEAGGLGLISQARR